MTSFAAESKTLKGQIRLSAPVSDAFRMFSPLGEKLWVPGWNPELLHPASATWQEQMIFRTREETGDAIWIITELDMSAHHVIYHRVEPGRYVTRILVDCTASADDITEARVEYSFVGLSETGNREIADMTQDAYDAKMACWEMWINDYFRENSKNPH